MNHAITGGVVVQGASGGIGAALTAALLELPTTTHVLATCRDPAASDALAALAERHGDRLLTSALDVTDEDTIAAAAERFAALGTPLGLLLNVAGLLHDGSMQPEKRLADLDPARLARSFAVNATGPALVAKHFARYFPRRERAVLASLSARVGSIGDNHLGGWYGYRASKAAQNMFTRNLSLELPRRHRGLICVALHPGTVDTALSKPFQANVPADRLFAPARAAAQLLDVIDGLEPGDNGGFFAWDGSPIPW
ncbi:MAG: SDR family NAD(P)-dependent oxidoreductase [Gammaproteobacteria bacterium]